MKLISRKEAKDKGLKRYFNGSVCVHGYRDERYTSTGHCVSCRKAQCADARKSNPEKWKQYRKEYYLSNRDQEITANNQWRLNNTDRVKTNRARWRKDNIEKTRIYLANYRAAKKNAVPSWLTDDDKFIINEVYIAAKNKEAYTGVPHHVDHIIPLQHPKVCGLHVWWNLQVLTASENFSKSNRLEEA